MFTSKLRAWIVVPIALAALAVSCGEDPTPTPQGPCAVPNACATASVTLAEWAVTEDGGGRLALNGRAGVTFEVRNDGTDIHQLAVWRGGVVENGEVSGGTRIGLSEGLRAGESDSLSLTLGPGTYLLTCPIPGHTGLGMHTELVIGEN